MIQILTILGSHRKKFTFKLVTKIQDELKKLSKNICFDILHLKDYKMDFCKGCLSCILNGEDTCGSSEITQKIKEKMEKADGVIFASPVYVKQVTAIMKNFFDHFSFLVHRPFQFDKAAIAITTANGSGINETIDYIEDTVKTFGFNFAGKLGIMTPIYELGGKKAKKIDKKIENLSKEFLDRIITKKPNSPKLADLLHFKITRLVIEFVKDHSQLDYDYWKQNAWLEMEYFTDVKINPLRKLLANMIFSSIKNSFKDANLKDY